MDINIECETDETGETGGELRILNWAQAASLRQRSPHPRSPSPKERGQCAVVRSKENYEF